jgi:hypothetical protein
VREQHPAITPAAAAPPAPPVTAPIATDPVPLVDQTARGELDAVPEPAVLPLPSLPTLDEQVPDAPSPATAAPARPAPAAPMREEPTAARPSMAAAPAGLPSGGDEGAMERGATAPQLRRFIKSRAYVPMHELRRRFAINGADDDVTAVDVERRRVFVGLPEREGRLLGELLRGGDIGYELSLDPISPIVVGVYPMRPVTRA